MITYRKRLSVALGAVVLAGATAGIGLTLGHDSGPLNTAHAVDLAPVLAQSITGWQTYSGRLEAVDHVDVRPLVPGTIVAVHLQGRRNRQEGRPAPLRLTQSRTSRK